MIDHFVGRPNPSWKRMQVFLVVLFWLWRILQGNSGPPPILWLSRLNRYLRRFTPWQLIVSTLTAIYAVRNFDKILGLQSPEPLANLYSPSYYRATWIITGLDAGFATAMSIRPKWLRDLCSVLFSGYYMLYPNEADEKLRRFRAVPTVEMLRATWEKTTNPWIRSFSPLPPVTIRRKILLARPKVSPCQRPITVYLFFASTDASLSQSSDLILDIPGGGFIAMNPEHHEDRLRMWARSTGKPVLSLDYGKAPEYPYPFAIDEAFDLYRLLVDSGGRIIGMSGHNLKIIVTGDSAGACIAVNVVLKILEQPWNLLTLPKPHAMALSYAALDFNFTSWMTPDNLRILRSEEPSGDLPGLQNLSEEYNGLKQNINPLSVVGDNRPGVPCPKRLKRRSSWKDTYMSGFAGGNDEAGPRLKEKSHSPNSTRVSMGRKSFLRARTSFADENRSSSEEEDDFLCRVDKRRSPNNVKCNSPTVPPTAPSATALHTERQEDLSAAVSAADHKVSHLSQEPKLPTGTRLTMASRTSYFTDRIISPTMMRAMAILYIGPNHNPDFATDYRISPVLAPSHLLAQFPPLLMQCGEKDPFVDDTVVFAGRIREAKRARKIELDMGLSGKSPKVGESLRMSVADVPLDGSRKLSMRKERDQLGRETEDDWAQIVIFSEWSHGYLQMPLIMPEAIAVIEDLAEWIDQAFGRFSTDNTTPIHHTSHSSAYADCPDQRPTSPFTSETETDDTGITFVPKKYQGRLSPTSLPRDKKLVDETQSNGNGGTSPPEADISSEGETLLDPDRDCMVMLGLVDGYQSPANQDVQKSNGPRQTGQTISETELMRRRRLLDSHFSSR
ncbi:alpha/beta-hydrolase [Guyanagaster necrorhizus]|uniref:Alpha/beta-hydrolase n=1 Tax=Guyanagaster necrorhizus TaxID=856835 RepID=A0A9P8ATW5_9AGAR|nr:alpha/beta-hydrolase [Guyanagaster necrorhizus MCA 3950]KAG7446287.1 alpha/beta-hydrolase [Guyanagaster necrorhizus MCA 3950]